MSSRIEIVNPDVPSRLGHIKHALIDFDGTISVIREGWEGVMIPLMIEMICDGKPPTPEIEKEVREYVDYSTGILTIKQMTWLSEAVQRHGISKSPKNPYEYKRIYNQRLLVRINERLERLMSGKVNPDDLMVAGARGFLQDLYDRGVTMYLASGTDHEYVVREAQALNVTEYFRGGIYGAVDHSEANDKERIIQRILTENKLSGDALLVVGDGPVEIRNAKARDAVALGVATDEVKRSGLNVHKRKRLIDAGADIIIPDFTRHSELVDFLLQKRAPEN